MPLFALCIYAHPIQIRKEIFQCKNVAVTNKIQQNTQVLFLKKSCAENMQIQLYISTVCSIVQQMRPKEQLAITSDA